MNSTTTKLASLLARAQAALGRIWGTAVLETKLNLFNPAPWVMGLVLGAFGYLAVRTAPDDSSFALSWILSHDLGPLTEILLLFLAASLAYRPQRYEVTELQDSKVVASEEIILGRWLGMVVAIGVPLLMQYLTTMIGQKTYAQNTLVPLAYLYSFWHLMPSVLFLTTLSFCLVVLTRVLILGAGFAGLLWFVLFFGHPYYPSVLRIELSQNRWVFNGLTGSFLVLMLLGYRGQRRAKRAPSTYGLAIASLLLFSVTAIHGLWIALAIPGKSSVVDDWKRLETAAKPKGEPLPNFAWNADNGQRISLAQMRGRPALLIFFQPKDSELLPLLNRMARLRTEFTADKLGLLGICFSEDLNGGDEAVRMAGTPATQGLPVVTDWGGITQGSFDARHPGSVVAWALHVRNTPAALLIGSDGREMTRDLPLDENSWTDLKLRLSSALKHEKLDPGLRYNPLPGILS
ncbi:MAG: hypothetical protein JO316_09675 [Abitibacteriaceae bacterium]|nr:hypothetical protein [Abditibacteriaceae bacterium]